MLVESSFFFASRDIDSLSNTCILVIASNAHRLPLTASVKR